MGGPDSLLVRITTCILVSLTNAIKIKSNIFTVFSAVKENKHTLTYGIVTRLFLFVSGPRLALARLLSGKQAIHLTV